MEKQKNTINTHILALRLKGISKRYNNTLPRIKYAYGITLIALVITIIILLILAGIVLNLTLGEHGIIKMAENAGKNYINAVDDEQKKLGELLNEADNIINGTDNSSNPVLPSTPPTIGIGETTHTSKQIQYTWEELSVLAKVISNNYGTGVGQVNNDTVEVAVSINGKADTLGIGDWTTVNGYQVRILGFNHDALTNENAYGNGETNTYAGISFEFAECITTAEMNSTQSNVNGWKACNLRGTLNSTTYDSLENKEYIKEINKEYIETYNDENSVTTVQDKIWLLSCSEIWNNGRDGQPYGYAVASEGEQYKYYKNINTDSNTVDTSLTKKDNGSNTAWWLRSPRYNSSSGFCTIDANGSCDRNHATDILGVAPGFSI